MEKYDEELSDYWSDDTIHVPTDASPLDFLCRVYRDSRQPLSARIKCAGLAAPFIHPKLAVTAVVSEGDMASRIDAARAASRAVLEARVTSMVEARLRARLAPPVDLTPEPPPMTVGRQPTPINAPFARSRIRRI
jgi:hypothetical protein